MVQINSNYKATENFSALKISDNIIRVFEKRDFTFRVTGFDDFGKGVESTRGIQFEYLDEIYSMPINIFIKKTKPALVVNDIEQNIILKYIGGSKMYGTNREDSDTDYRGVYVLPEEFYSKYVFDDDDEEVRVKDVKTNSESTYYSLRKYLTLIEDQNPNILESLNIPEDCLLYKDPIMDTIFKFVKHFITKKCYYTFVSYAESQINKASGQDKMQNWNKEKMERKTVLDFCYVFHKQGSIPLKEMLKISFDLHGFGGLQEEYGLVKVPHMRDNYAAFHDFTKYRGIVTDEEKSNDVCLSSVNKDSPPAFYLYFNKDGYSKHCSDYRKYTQWNDEKNEGRWIDVKNHDQKLDGKNLLHCMRLIYMAEDLANGKGIVVKRPEAEYLKSIRLGDVQLETILTDAQKRLISMKSLFDNADLPTIVDHSFIDILYQMIKKEYWQRQIELKYELK